MLGHTKIESTVRYLGIEIDDAIEIAEKIDVSNTWAELPRSAQFKPAKECHFRTSAVR